MIQTLAKHWRRLVITLLPLLLALLHAGAYLPIEVLHRLDDLIYDARLRATMPKTLDDRIVVVDIDEKSLAEVGRWPWGRDKMAGLVDELFDRQKIALLGFDVVFAEPDESSGLKKLQELASTDLRGQAGFAERLSQLQPQLDYDARFAKSLESRPIVMGYYMTSDRDGHVNGALPQPVMKQEALQNKPIRFFTWSGHSGNINTLAASAPHAGYFNSVTDSDGVVRSIPLVSEYKGAYYESLSLAMFRMLLGFPSVEPGFPQERILPRNYHGLESILLRQKSDVFAIPVDNRVGTLVPYRGAGGISGGSFKYISAADVLAKRVHADSLKGKIVLFGTTAPGLLDLRVTPVGEIYPGVEVHANIISGLLDGRLYVKPDYAMGFEFVILIFAGLALALSLPLLSATRAVLLSLGVIAALIGLNFWLYLGYGLVLPLAAALVMSLAAFALNMSYGYFIESKSKRDLANLFRGYIPPQLVDEMLDDPQSYNMQAANKEITVMFCDMRGFTNLSERMEPTQLQTLLNGVFTRLTQIIQENRGTIDKYMGDCVMAFWGAPIENPQHANLAVKTALEMSAAIRQLNIDHRAQNLPEIGVGIGINTGTMCVGNMGSDIRRSYTVIGDAVNLGSRLEGLSKTYGVDIVVSESTRKTVGDVTWQELDKVRVKGKQQAVSIFWPTGLTEQTPKETLEEIKLWNNFLKAYRSQDWDQCDLQLLNLKRHNQGKNAKKFLYQLYADRVASMRLLPFDPSWDGATNFDTK